MTKTNKIAEALANYANVYRTLLTNSEFKVYNVDVAVEYAVADMWNQVKRASEEDAIFRINDEALYIQEKMGVAA